jgi:DNA-binding HxlR family transcriptional regulator
MAADSNMAHVYRMPELKACPIETTFRIIGKKWTVLVLREMFLGVTQFNRLEENVGGITSKVLSQRLKELQRLGIVRRRIVSEAPIRVEYGLTELGEELGPVLASAAAFSMRFLPKAVFKDEKARSLTQIPAR